MSKPSDTYDPSVDETHLARFGYKPKLNRSLGTFDSFAFAFSYFSSIANLVLIMGLGVAFAGAAFIWAWPIVVVGMLCVTLLFCEMAAHYPLAGSLYNWSKVLSKKAASSWMAGWLIVVTVILGFTSIAPAFAFVLPQIWSGFQVYGDGTGQYDFATNAVILGTIAFALSTAIQSIGVKYVSLVNKIGIRIEIAAAVVFVIAFLVRRQHGPSVLFDTNGTGSGHTGGYVAAFAIGAIACMYSLYGMDAASDMAEETKDPRRRAPRSMLYAVAGAAVTFFLIAITALMAVNDPTSPELASGGLGYVIRESFGPVWGRVALVVVLFALFSAMLAIHAFAVRVTFGMARDNNLPWSSALSRVNSSTKSPIICAVVVGVFAVVLLLINVRQPQIVGVLIAVSTATAYLAYLFVVGPMLLARFQGRWPKPDNDSRGYFSLGNWGLLVNIAALAYLTIGFLNLVWPRSVIYNPAPPEHWYLQWGGVVFTAIIVIVGYGWYMLRGRHQTGILAEHSVTDADLATERPIPDVKPAGARD